MGETKNINVLMLSLSIFPQNKEKKDEKLITESIFTYDSKNYIGRYQLDPVPKLLSDKLKRKGETLDYIIAFCTKKGDEDPIVVKRKKVTVPEENEDGETLLDSNGNIKSIVKNISELEYFESQIKRYLNNSIDKNIIRIDIDEEKPEEGIGEAIKQIHGLENDNNKVHLYLDPHGGFREISLTLLAIISLLSKEDITVEENFSVKYKDSDGASNEITSDKSMDMFDFASGINEYINYGRLTSLRRFVAKYKDNDEVQEINKFINILTLISDNISICNTDGFEQGLTDLTKYFESLSETTIDYLGYFSLFVDSIKRDFGVLLGKERTVVDEIKWCYRKEYYQQALTLIESKMPGEFVRNGIKYYEYEGAIDSFVECYCKTNKKERWKFNDTAHYFIKYYSKMENNLDHKLTIKSSFDESSMGGIDLLISAYFALSRFRNGINHGGTTTAGENGEEYTVKSLKLAISKFIWEYEDILSSKNNFEEIRELSISDIEQSCNLDVQKSDEWNQICVSSSGTEKEIELLKKVKFVFMKQEYPENRNSYPKIRSDIEKICTGSVPGKVELENKSPLKVIEELSQGEFIIEGNDMIWCP